MSAHIDIKKYLKIVILVIFIVIIAFTLKSMINSTPSQASLSDTITVDIGGDDFLVAHLDECLKINEKSIDDGFALNKNIKEVHWYDATNISFVDSSGHDGFMITWKTSLQNYKDSNINGTEYGELTGELEKASYFITYNPTKTSIYGIILDKHGYDVKNLIHDVLGFNLPKQDETFNTSSDYNTNYNSYSSSSHRSPNYDVDTSPETIAKNDPDWYYDHYEYGDYPEIDDYLESQGYEGDYPDDYPSDYSEYY